MVFMDHFLIFVFVVLIPYSGWRSYPGFLESLQHNPVAARRSLYISSITALIAMGIVTTLWWMFSDRPLNGLGLSLDPARYRELATALAVVLTLTVLTVLFFNSLVELERRYRFNLVPEILPHTRTELRQFTAMSVAAGVSEEIIYRGFLMAYLYALGFETVVVLILSTVIFAVAHAYQGLKALLLILPIGFIFAAIYLYCGSLWPSMLLHILIDVYSGLAGYRVNQLNVADQLTDSREVQA